MLDHSSGHSASANGGVCDVVSELLAGMRLRGLDYQRLQISPPFGVSYGEDESHAQFHFVAQGDVFLRAPDQTLHRLNAGDAVLLPRGGVHALLSQPRFGCQRIEAFSAKTVYGSVKDVVACDPGAAQEDRVVVFSGAMAFELGAMDPLMSLMPEVMHVGKFHDHHPKALPILEAMECEARTARTGFASILTRLAEVVSASIVRDWVERGCGNASGWVAALRDARLGQVIAAVHRDPGHDWTVDKMAKVMGSSRSVFAERFQAVAGVTPLRYVTEVKMRMATQWLSRDRLSVEVVADRLGYGSHAAFSRAYKRVTGFSPGKIRNGAASHERVTV